MIAPWASEEMEAADFGDERLDVRGVTLLSALGNRPNLSIPAACGGRAELKAAYRFFDNDKVSFDKVRSVLGLPGYGQFYKGKPIIYGTGNFFAQSEFIQRVPYDSYESWGHDMNRLPTLNPADHPR